MSVTREIRQIVAAYDTARANGTRALLATVVYVEGSSYRRPGARMLVDENGMMTGAISGGCLEGDALRKALLAITRGTPRLVMYDTTDEEDAVIGVQLGCAGIIQVLFEPVDDTNPDNPVELLRKSVTGRTPSVIVTVSLPERYADNHPGTLLLMNDSMVRFAREAEFPDLKAEALFSLRSGVSRFITRQLTAGTANIFVEYLQPPVSLVVVGAGNDVIPVVKMADLLGWEVHVADGRGTHAKEDRFVAACQVLVGKPEAVLDKIATDERTAFILMSHNFQYDKAMLRALLPLDIPYIGVLGPKKKLNRMLDDLRSEGMLIPADLLKKVYGPTGLEIGAETPEEIALSMLAEIQAVFNHRPGGYLRDKSTVIHDRATPGW
jgi:xanthine/CO dehydrogenase XdhC/CoxF family maturation factor